MYNSSMTSLNQLCGYNWIHWYLEKQVNRVHMAQCTHICKINATASIYYMDIVKYISGTTIQQLKSSLCSWPNVQACTSVAVLYPKLIFRANMNISWIWAITFRLTEFSSLLKVKFVQMGLQYVKIFICKCSTSVDL